MTLEFEAYWTRLVNGTPRLRIEGQITRMTTEQLQAALERAFIAGYAAAKNREKYDLPEGFDALFGGPR